ncbi:MAG: hypothetical protein AMJ95_12335 [Omnitrophica WOR_2 bacterium SM23_72]|jgi:hypothetical protein|nr:MAG: hypothetical protein AMJ95_12335 [Omnitrophica WOR_2 bacterium SM23_72]
MPNSTCSGSAWSKIALVIFCLFMVIAPRGLLAGLRLFQRCPVLGPKSKSPYDFLVHSQAFRNLSKTLQFGKVSQRT